ncbi:MAG TPA: GntR family transcriptional regulator [Bosea sp. (in: a-proteobacteria)]|jgi:DNA-binding GntR family transcriptional regulator|uniref:GntR family transcriptional regulator n=1 Tax=Bosea sp. (in: a-proteobacteria) TaxID=1871050 RepID=UPI002E13AA29|nr:GntR family transcriptional regulator [Bosea sp. (in: a-proteobacteria)]
MKPAENAMSTDARTRLRSMILGGELLPGQRLVEDELCERLGAGRTPVREALLLMQGEGYLTRERGWVVRQVVRSQVGAIFESRAAAEGATARLAARRVTPEELARLSALIEQMQPAESLTRHELNRLNGLFHQAIVDAAANPLLAQFHERTQFQYWMLRVPVLFAEHEIRHSNEQHAAILAALAAGDEDTAERAAREHVETTRAIVEPALHL